VSFESVRWAAEFGAVQALAYLARRLTPATRLSVGRALGSAVYHLDARHRRVALKNLEAALPGLSPRERRAVAKGSFRHLGRLLVEILEHGGPPEPLLDRCRIEGLDHLKAAAEAGRGYFLLSAHFGNWERVAFLQAALGHPLWMIARPLDNPRLEAFLAQRRERTGNRVIHKRRAVREMVRGLREGRGVAIVIDQNFGEPGRVFVPFFGRPAATTPVLGSLAVRTGAAVLPVFAFPEPEGRYRIVYGPPLEVPSTGDADADAAAVTAAATAHIEAAVRACPTAWFWMHRRWRTRPDGGDRDP
jgi:KDO2-lipid IV(A) lauroyltransferase